MANKQIACYYTNEELARAWFRTVAQYDISGKSKKYSARKAEIAGCPVDLFDHYYRHGTLRGAIEGTGRVILELILEKGEDVIKEKVAAKRVEAMSKAQDRRMRFLELDYTYNQGNRGDDDFGHCWDNAVRAVEDH